MTEPAYYEDPPSDDEQAQEDAEDEDVDDEYEPSYDADDPVVGDFIDTDDLEER